LIDAKRLDHLLLHHLDRARPEAASAAPARQTARKLKQSSRNGSTPEGAEKARVIPLKFVTGVLNDYASERGPKVAAPRVIGAAVDALTEFWQGRVVAD
jgi:hypothetical protein